MKKLLVALATVVGLLLVVGAGAFLWASSKADARLTKKVETHRVDFPVPFPLSEAEFAALRAERQPAPEPTKASGKQPAAEAPVPPVDVLAGVDLLALARERAMARGKHLVEARYACGICHGANFAGGVMIDDPAIGKVLGPNLTTGRGSRTLDYTAADWDRIVRHGVKPDGTPAAMPSEDFFKMTDQELSDIVAYIRSMPAVDATVPAPTLGPVGTFLMATGKMPVSAENLPDHQAPHAVVAPVAAETAEFGAHLAAVCTGCHQANLAGGTIPAGPPNWPVASNLTPHATGMQAWTFEDFEKLLTTGMRKNGQLARDPMNLIAPIGKAMTPVERKALWTYLRSLPPLPMNP